MRKEGDIFSPGLWPYSRDISIQLLYSPPQGLVPGKNSWLWFSVYPFLLYLSPLALSPHSPMPNDTCPSFFSHLTQLINEQNGQTQLLGELRHSVWALNPECLPMNLPHLDLEHLLCPLTPLTLKLSCSRILAPNQPSLTRAFFLLTRTDLS